MESKTTQKTTLRRVVAVAAALFALLQIGAARANEAAMDLIEIGTAISGFGICPGFNQVLTGNITDSSAGDEMVYFQRHRQILPDTDLDQLHEMRMLVTVFVKSSSTGTILWQSATLPIKTEDIITPLPPAGYSYPLFLPTTGAFTSLISFFGFGTDCIGLAVATHGGQKYVIVGGGSSAAEGNPLAGTDHSRIRLRVLNASTGATVRTHSFGPVANRFLVPFLPTIADIDDDGDFEVLEWRANVLSNTMVTGIMTSRDLITGAVEDTVNIPLKDTLAFPP